MFASASCRSLDTPSTLWVSATPESAILSAVVNPTRSSSSPSIPLAAPRCAKHRALIGADGLLRRNLLIYGLGGIVVPFVGIKAIDLLLELVKFP